MKNSRGFWGFSQQAIYLSCLIMLTVALRLYDMNDLSGSDDSTWAQLSYMTSSRGNMLYPYIDDSSMAWAGYAFLRPSGIAVISLSTVLLGPTNLALMLPVALFSAGSVLLLFFILKRWGGRAAVLGSAFFAVSPFFVGLTRIATFNAMLIFTMLLAAFLYMKGVDDKKPLYFYLAALACLVNFTTTEIRGVLPLAGLLPFFYLRRIKKRLLKHIIISSGIAVLAYLAYLFIPAMLGDAGPVNSILGAFEHGAGLRETSANYLPFAEAVKTLGAFLIFTPFVGLIFVPLVYGIYRALKDFKDSDNAFWLGGTLTMVFFFIQGQPYPERLILYSPAFAAFAALGIDKATQKGRLLLMGLSFAYMFVMLKMFSIFFPEEYNGLLGLPYHYLLEFAVRWFYIPLILVAVLSAFRLKIPVKPVLQAYLITNILLVIVLVAAGIGIFHKPDIGPVATYLMDQDAEYSCVAGLHAKSLTYYTQKPCAYWLNVDTAWLDKHAASGDVRYFVLDKVNDFHTVGFGDYGRMEKGEFYTPGNTSTWQIDFPDKYYWLKENTDEVTQLVFGGEPSEFRVFEYARSQQARP